MRIVLLVRKLAWVVAAGAMFGTALVAGENMPRAAAPEICACTPTAETVARVLDGWRLAEAYAAAHPDCDVFVGRGDSMLPLYRDRTVLVVHVVAMKELQPGMTVVFTGDKGNLVAHTLLEQTPAGWRAIGVGNRAPDRTLVRRGNLVGVVVKAYATALPGRAVALQ